MSYADANAVGPDVIPMQVARAVDTDLTNVSASELMLYRLANL